MNYSSNCFHRLCNRPAELISDSIDTPSRRDTTLRNTDTTRMLVEFHRSARTSSSDSPARSYLSCPVAPDGNGLGAEERGACGCGWRWRRWRRLLRVPAEAVRAGPGRGAESLGARRRRELAAGARARAARARPPEAHTRRPADAAARVNTEAHLMGCN